MGKSVNLKGKRFGRLEVIRKIQKVWQCRCDCGNVVFVPTNYLTNKKKQSCNCLRTEASSKRSTTHGKSKTITYKSWCMMKRRCLDENYENYPLYGGRGIKVCNRWINSFENFLEDMGERPKNYTLDRIDNNGNYEPNNCKWSTQKEQCNNTRKNHVIQFQGKKKTLKQWSEETGIAWFTIWARLEKLGWTIKKSLTTPTMTYSESAKLAWSKCKK